MGKQVGITKAQRNALTKNILTEDGFNNFFAKLGLQSNNLSSQGTYNIGNLLSRQRELLERIYRTSWVAGQVIDCIAEDMTREGITINTSELSPNEIQKMQSSFIEMGIDQKVCSTLKWGRLYGGALAVILIEGADMKTPLDHTKIKKGQFKGLWSVDRWHVDPSYNNLVSEFGPDIGKPKYYNILPGAEVFSGENIHHSRVIRFDGIEMPWQQKRYDNLWGMSVIERMYDRLIAFDSATTGAAQLLYKAYLRVIQVDGLRQALALGGNVENAVIKQFQYIAMMQSLEGITLLDAKDTFSTHNYSFAGVSDVLIQFGQQISGATGIPLVRLFGQSPAGLSSTGESDLRNYYDSINKLQRNLMLVHYKTLCSLMCASLFGKELPKDFMFDFNPLWQLSDTEKATIASSHSTTINAYHGAGIIKKKTALQEARKLSSITGIMSSITDEDIKTAVDEPPEHFGGGGNEGGKEDNNEVNTSKLESLLGKEKKEVTEEDEKPIETIEELETSLSDLITLEDLEQQLKDLDGQTIEQVEQQLLQFINKEKSLDDLMNELEKIDMPKDIFELLEKEIRELGTRKPLQKKMPASISGRGISFDSAVRNTFGIKDASYAGNVGFEEMTKFYKVASKEDQNLMDQFANQGNWQNIKNLIRKVLGITLHDSITKDKDEKWITIKGKENSRKVKLDENGNIIGGDLPKEAQGKKMSALKEVYKEKGKEEKPKKKANKEVINKIRQRKWDKPEEKGIQRTKTTANYGLAVRKEDGTLTDSKGKALPKHIQDIYIAPAWTNVLYSPDPKASLLVYGKDEAGRWQPVYNKKHETKSSKSKFARIDELDKKFKEIMSEVEVDFKKGDDIKKTSATIIKLIVDTGVRPGNERDTKAQVKAYGATTLEGQHIKKNKDGSVRLEFIGKKGVLNNIPITDKSMVKNIIMLSKNISPNQKVFPDVKYPQLLKYVKQLDGGKFVTKDFRTLLATKSAMKEVSKIKVMPTNEKEYKKAIKEVAVKISAMLGNTPTVCLQKYIHPSVFAEWKLKAGVK